MTSEIIKLPSTKKGDVLKLQIDIKSLPSGYYSWKVIAIN